MAQHEAILEREAATPVRRISSPSSTPNDLYELVDLATNRDCGPSAATITSSIEPHRRGRGLWRVI